MDSQRFRGFLVKLQDRLSDDDRRRLHFYLGDDVPRRIRDDPTLGGTLGLLESLFEQDKINENDFTYLIDAFDQIQCFDAVKLLREFWRQNQEKGLTQSIESLSLMMPSLLSEIFEEEDKYATKRVFHQPKIEPNPSPILLNEQKPAPMERTISKKFFVTLAIIVVCTSSIFLVVSIRNSISNDQSTKSFHKSVQLIERITYDVNKLEKRGSPNHLTLWKTKANTVVGLSVSTQLLKGLHYPMGICIDQDRTIYIAELSNHRITAWPIHSEIGVNVAGIGYQGMRAEQLNSPMDVIFDPELDELFICDWGNLRVVRWPRRQLGNYTRMVTPSPDGTTIIGTIDCFGLALDIEGFLYVSDSVKNEVRRYDRNGIEQGTTPVAGGNGKGKGLHQLDHPSYLFIDDKFTLYVSDTLNHRVMKWPRDATQGIVVAGGKTEGKSLGHLFHPRGLWVDAWGYIYVVDQSNNRVMRWKEGMANGTVIAGDKGQGKGSNQLSNPQDLSFDQWGNMYVSDYDNHRIQRFTVI